MKKINIAFICDYLAIGGQERACVNLVSSINRSIVHPTVYAFRGGEFVNNIRDLGIKVLLGSKKSPLSFKKEWTNKDENEKKAYLNMLRRVLENDRIDIALIFSWHDGAIAARRAGVTVVIERLDGPALIEKIKDKSCFDKVVCQSVGIKKLILEQKRNLKLTKEQICVIHQGVNLERFNRHVFNASAERRKLGIKPDEFVIGYTGRLVDTKNLQLLIKTAKVLVSRYRINNLRVLIAGPDHGALGNLKKLVKRLEMSKTVLFHKATREIGNLLSVLDVFVMTSLTGEGVPNAMIEAMAMGLPIVSTRVGSIPEVIDGNGFLVEGFDAKSMAKTIHVLMNDVSLKENMARQSLRLSHKFDLKRTAKEYEDLFRECLQRAPAL